ncbi:MAG: hypothetical protein NVS2B17_34220 [Candidatus Velthaea sp.]
MNRFVSMIMAAALVASLGSGAFAKDKDKSKGDAMKSPMGMTTMEKCAPGKKYVKGYTKKHGVKVKGYCR